MYRDRLERVVLFGSRARGDAQQQSPDFNVERAGGKVVKSHKGVNIEFLRHEGRFSLYAGPIAEVSSQEAVNAVEVARTFVATVRRALAP
jgi:hypothetical protein